MKYGECAMPVRAHSKNSLTLYCMMLKMAKHTLKILRCEHRKIFKVYLPIFQHYAIKG